MAPILKVISLQFVFCVEEENHIRYSPSVNDPAYELACGVDMMFTYKEICDKLGPAHRVNRRVPIGLATNSRARAVLRAVSANTVLYVMRTRIPLGTGMMSFKKNGYKTRM